MMVKQKDPLIEQMMASPHFPRYMQELNAILANEKEQRLAFYNQITEGDKAEYINGEIIFHSPVKLRYNAASGNLYRLLSSYVLLNNLGLVGYEKLLIALTRNDYEPDICFFSNEKSERFTADQMRFPAPDFIVEVLSKSTEANDRGIKFEDYAAHHVAEYWIIDPVTETIEQYYLQNEGYQLHIKAKTGDIESKTINGFTIPIRAIFDDATNREALQHLLTT